jgi:hypothetical protein
MDREFLMRLAVFLPLVFITFQVVMLRRLLPSPAWTLLALGFLMFVAARSLTLFSDAGVIVPAGMALVGYALIAVGFHVFRGDLLRVLRGSRAE